MAEHGASAKQRGLALGWGVSLALHAAVVGAGFLLVWSIQGTPDEPYATEARTVVFQDAGLAPKAQHSPSETDSAAVNDVLDALFAPPVAPPTQNAPPLDTGIRSVDPALLAPVDSTPPMLEPTMSNEAEFFGTGASDARRIVYVVDASGSSTALFPAIARELEDSLLSLNATQHATIIVAKGIPARDGAGASAVSLKAPGDGLVRATTKGAQRLTSWFAQEVTPSGRSDLLDALRAALALEPDAVFLLATPGNASSQRDGFLDALDRMNPIDTRTGRRRSIIGVVCVGAPAFDDPLAALSRAHNDGAEPEVRERNDLLEGP